jgi:hypothetical protein
MNLNAGRHHDAGPHPICPSARISYGCVVFAILASIMLYFAFSGNRFATLGGKSFIGQQADSEATIIGRLAASRYEGMISHGGLEGKYFLPDSDLELTIYQIDIYNGTKPLGDWGPYPSEIGLHAIVLSIIDRLLPFRDNTTTYRSLVAVLNAGCFGILVAWLASYFGTFGAAMAVLSLITSLWMVGLGRNFAVVIGIHFFPFLVTLCILWCESLGRRIAAPTFFMLVFCAFVAKFAASYVWAPNVALSALVPVAFYAIYDRWSLKKIITQTFLIGSACVAALLVAIAIHVVMLARIEPDIQSAFLVLFGRAVVRFGIDLPQFKQFVNEGDFAGISLFSTFEKCLNYPVFHFWPLLNWTFGDSLMLLGAGLVATYSISYSLGLSKSPLHRARIASTVLAFAVPLPWMVLARQHSWVHPFINSVQFYMPLIPMGAALVGSAVMDATRAVLTKAGPGLSGLIKAMTVLVIASFAADKAIEVDRNAKAELSAAENADRVPGTPSDVQVSISGRDLYVRRSDCFKAGRYARVELQFKPRNSNELADRFLLQGYYDDFLDWVDQSVRTAPFIVWTTCIIHIQLPNFPMVWLEIGEWNDVWMRPSWSVPVIGTRKDGG